MKHNGTKTLEMKQLMLRKFTLEDSSSYFMNVMSDEKVFEFFAFGAHKAVEETIQEIQDVIASYENLEVYQWAIVEKKSNQVIGKISIDSRELNSLQSCEVAYLIGSKWWGKGYATAALTAVIAYLFDEDTYLIEAKHSSQNPASGKVLQKAGMRREAVLADRRIDKRTGLRYDVVIYSIRNPHMIQRNDELSKELKAYFIEFMKEYDYPLQAQTELHDNYNRLQQKEIWTDFIRLVEAYEADSNKLNDDTIKELQRIAIESEVSEFSISLIYLIVISKYLRRRYEEKHWTDQMFHDAMMDLRFKLHECYQLHDIWGNFVIWWEIGFFQMTRVALGRLQFEIKECFVDYMKDGFILKKGDPVINLHIPSSGPLLETDCQQAYKEAAKFYQEYFPGKVIWFICSSWLLYPQNKKMLPEDSNIVRFMKDFDIISCEVDEKKEDLWRIFYKESNRPANELPRKTRIQRAVSSWLQAGNSVGIGHGIFYLKKPER